MLHKRFMLNKGVGDAPCVPRLGWLVGLRVVLRVGLRSNVLAWACLPAVCAAQLSPTARLEVEGLLRAVGSSGCEFIRGGTAYPAAKAQDHLHLKFVYLDEREQLKTAEDFIAKAATRSSMTGVAYGIRCAGAAPQASEEWLKARLNVLRHTQPPVQPKR